MEQQEKSFWEWWKKIERYQDRWNLRMAWDSGYQSALKDLKGEE
jgi:hypothetical protein